MEGYCSTGQSPQWAVVPMEEEEEPKSAIDCLSDSNTGTHVIIQIMCIPLTYPHTEVLRGRVNPAMWRQGAGNVLQTDCSDLN